MRGHYLLSGSPDEILPDFLDTRTPDIALEHAEQIKEFIENYISTVVSHNHGTTGSVYAWDVIDEAIDAWNPYDVVDDWMCFAFRVARYADEETLLFYSDAGFTDVTQDDKLHSDAVFELVKQMKERGDDCPLDGVAMKIHLDVQANSTAIDGLRANIQRFDTLGLKVHLTRVVVECVLQEDGKCDEHYTMYYEQEQAQIFTDLLQVCAQEPNCEVLEVKGLSESYIPDNTHGQLFDSAGYKKAAYYQMLDYLTTGYYDE